MVLRGPKFSVSIYRTSESRPILLAAAAEQFAKYGPRDTRAQDIVNAAGINQRMICHHFGSKDALYAGVMREQRARLGGSWQPILERAVTMGPYPGMQLAFPEGFSGLPAPVRPLHERGQAEGVFPADVPFGIAYVTVVSCRVAMVIFAPRFAGLAEPGLETDLARFRDKIIGQLMNGVTGDPGRSSHHPPAMQ